MSVFDYVDIPPYATIVPTTSTKVNSSLPPSSNAPEDSATSSVPGNTPTPTRTVFGNLPGILVASSLQIPTNVLNPNPRNVSQLVSTRDPLSVPTTTVNFRRFISRIGPLFWLQDRIEEIVTWKKGWKVTVLWMMAYSFICYHPRIILLLPNIIVLIIIITAHPRTSLGTGSSITEQIQPPPRALAREGSTEWLGNIQGVQNLMGLLADVHEASFPYLLHLTFSTPYTPQIFTITLLGTLLAFPFLSLIPLRPLFLIGGLAPFAFTHPLIRRTLPLFLSNLPLPYVRARFMRLIYDDRLKDRHWQSELREVELFENERWFPAGESTGWSKANLKSGERVAWTRGRDGWTGVAADGNSDISNLTFMLAPNWEFVETEDWRADIEAKWSEVGADDLGWVYTNDAWLEPHASPMNERKTNPATMTRRRRWLRRIYLNPAVPPVL